MAVFEAKDMTVRTGILEGQGPGKVLEIEFTGVHTRHWPPEGSPTKFIEGEVKSSRPAANSCVMTSKRNRVSDPEIERTLTGS